MGIRRTPWSEERIQEYQAAGRGSGEGENYKPWVRVQDLDSDGRSSRLVLPRFGKNRIIELLSDLEYHTLNLIDFETNVICIKEQFPLARALTRAAADLLQIRHPCYPGTKIHAVLTIDFYVTRLVNALPVKQAVFTKTAADLDDPREVEKLCIVSKVLERKNEWHKIVLDTHLPKMRCRNLEWMRGGYIRDGQLQDHPRQDEDVRRRLSYALKQSSNSLLPLHEFCLESDRALGILKGSCLKAARQLFWDRTLLADIDAGDLEQTPVAGITLTGTQGQLRLMEAAHG